MTVLAQLERGNFFSSAITKHCFFPSVHDAVVHISKEPRQASVSTQPRHPHHCDGEVGGGVTAAKLTHLCLSPLGGPQHQNVALREEDISPTSWTSKGGFAALMAPTHPPWGPGALCPHQPLRTLESRGPALAVSSPCDRAAADHRAEVPAGSPRSAPPWAHPTRPGPGLGGVRGTPGPG